jgi:hypothetical protein
MDLKSITAILSNQESTFRTIIASAKNDIDSDALKAKLTLHYINLVVIASSKYPMEADTLDDPPTSTSESTKCPCKRRGSTPNQMVATPMGRSTSYSRPMQAAGASRLFGKRAACVVDLVESDDDSAGSAAEEGGGGGGDEMFVSPTSSPPRARRRKRFMTRAEKEAERKRGRREGMGMSAASSSSSGCGSGSRVQVVIPGRRRRELSDEGMDIDAAGFEGGKDGAANDREMEELLQFANDEDEAPEEEGEDEGESPSKRRRSV